MNARIRVIRKVLRLPLGESPQVFSTEIEENEQVIAVSEFPIPGGRHRKTQDWAMGVTVVSYS